MKITYLILLTLLSLARGGDLRFSEGLREGVGHPDEGVRRGVVQLNEGVRGEVGHLNEGVRGVYDELNEERI